MWEFRENIYLLKHGERRKISKMEGNNEGENLFGNRIKVKGSFDLGKRQNVLSHPTHQKSGQKWRPRSERNVDKSLVAKGTNMSDHQAVENLVLLIRNDT